MSGWLVGKFYVTHHLRGPLGDREAFVLVPGRDPAAVVALRAYARATDDRATAEEVSRWVGTDPPRAVELDALDAWVEVLSDEVRSGAMTLETALRRIAGHAAENTRRVITG